MVSMPRLSIFLDTNTFLHYETIDHVNWVELLGGKPVVLIVAPVVIRELNRQKDTPTSAKTRKRAAAALSKLHEWSDRPSPILIRKSVELQFRVQDSQINFGAVNLSRDIADDHLIASILEYRTESGEDETTLATADLGLKLKARTHQVPVLQVPSDLRLPEELLPEEKRLRELESELRRLRDRLPAVSLLFDTGEQLLKGVLPTSEKPNTKSSVASIMHVRTEYPKMEVPRDDGSSNSDFGFFMKLNTIPSEEIVRYNDQLDDFYAAHEEYVSTLERLRDLIGRTMRLNVMAVNAGTCPAQDVDVLMHFPDGFLLLTDKEMLKSPPKPKPPAKPQTTAERAVAAFQTPAYVPSFSSVYADSTLAMRVPAPTNVSHPKIRRTNSYEVKVSIATLKHGFDEQLDALYLVFDSGESARSFTIDYLIHASNLPGPSKGQLHVIIDTFATK
jgi:rRNA-processing protein FCF1